MRPYLVIIIEGVFHHLPGFINVGEFVWLDVVSLYRIVKRFDVSIILRRMFLDEFAIISGLDRNTSEIYGQYKSREEAEQAFDTMKGDLEPDRTCLRDSEKVKGFFFIVFLALRIRFKILKVLKDHIVLGKMSVNEIIFELSKMERIVEKSGVEYFAAVPKKVEKIVDLFKDMIPMG